MTAKPKHKELSMLTQLVCAVVICVLGATLMIWGFCVPPRGEIHPSVLAGVGEFLTFAGALFGIDYTYKYKIHRDETNN